MALHQRIIHHATSSQSHVIVAMVLLSFIVWATLRGHLSKYLNDLGIGKKPISPAAQASVNQGMGAAIGGGGGAGGWWGQIGNLPSLPTFPGQPQLGFPGQ